MQSKHPLALKRSLLLAAYNQVYELVEERKQKQMPADDQMRELARIHLRLVQCQDMCKRFGV